MKARSFHRQMAVFIAAGLCAVLLPLAVGSGLAYLKAVHEIRADLSARAGYALALVETSLEQVAQTLADFTYEAKRGCTDATLEELALTAARIPEARVISLVEDGGIRCDSLLGVVGSHGTIENDAFYQRVFSSLPFDVQFSEIRKEPTSPDQDRYFLAASLIDDDHAIVLEVPTAALKERFSALLDFTGGSLSIQIMDAAFYLGTEPRPDDYSAVQTSTRFPITIDVRQSQRALVGAWQQSAVLALLLGSLAAAALVLLLVRVAKRRLSLHGELEQAIERQEFEVFYQPSIALASNTCNGAEALIRWRHPEQGLVRPDLFIPLAEDSGLIVPITELLIDAIIQDIGPTLQADRSLHIGINLAPAHFQSLGILQSAERLYAAGVRPDQVVWEITERALVDDPVARDVIDGLRRRGAAVALDDFGTGYSSLSYLSTFELDYLKIDKAFVEAIGTGSVQEGVVEDIVQLATRLGLECIAEGLETSAHVRKLRALKVVSAQGWFYAKPLPVTEFQAYLATTPRCPEPEPEPDSDPGTDAGAAEAPSTRPEGASALAQGAVAVA